MEIYETDDGMRDEKGMYWEFIKSMELTKEYDLFHKALVNKTHTIR